MNKYYLTLLLLLSHCYMQSNRSSLSKILKKFCFSALLATASTTSTSCINVSGLQNLPDPAQIASALYYLSNSFTTTTMSTQVSSIAFPNPTGPLYYSIPFPEPVSFTIAGISLLIQAGCITKHYYNAYQNRKNWEKIFLEKQKKIFSIRYLPKRDEPLQLTP